VFAFVAAAVLLLLVVLPPLGPTVSGSIPIQAWHGRLVATLPPDRPMPDGSGFLPDARVLMLDGPRAGREIDAYLQGPGGQQDVDAYRVGEDVVITETGDPGGGTFTAVADRWRLPQLLLLAAIFVLAVVLVGGWRGVRALLGLALTIAIILKVLIPLLVAGIPPIPVAVVTATGLTILLIGLTEGFGRTGAAAILGTSAALALTALLAALATAFAAFTNTQGSDLAYISLPNGEGLDLKGLLLAAFMIGSIGVLDDVTVTQAAAVDELGRQGLRGRSLFGAAFNVGRSHIGATVNTLFLAYVAVSLPLLVFAIVSAQPATLLVNGEPIAIEIVRTLVGSLGIVAAVPLTTVIAAWLAESAAGTAQVASAGGRGRAAAARAGVRSPAPILVGGLVAVGATTLVAAAVIGPATTSGPRPPLIPDQFAALPPASPSPSPVSGVPSARPVRSREAVPQFDVGEDIPLFDATAKQIGTVRVLTVDPKVAADGSVSISVRFRYAASASLAIDTGAWSADVGSGTPIAARTPDDAARHPALGGSLAAGGTRTGWLEFDLPAPPASVSLDFGEHGVVLFSVSLL
jgi:uncharacterized membrane protein